MAINLEDLRKASKDYLLNSVTCKVENYKADIPNALSPGEGFKFDLRVTNAGKIRIIKVKYHIFVTNPAIAKLVVPTGPFPLIRIARSGSSETSPFLAPGSQVTEMFLFPFDSDRKSLDPNEVDLWQSIKGVARVLGTTTLRFNVLGQIDLDYLFPSNSSSNPAQQTLNVV